MAKQLLHAANAADTPFVITAQSDIAGSLETATVYAQQLTDLGPNVTVNPVTHATFFANIPDSAKNSTITVLAIADRDWPARAATSFVPSAERDFTFWASSQWVKEFRVKECNLARRTVNPVVREKIEFALQKQMWADGCVLLPCSSPTLNAPDRDFAGMDDAGSRYPGLHVGAVHVRAGREA
jgi:hypothetical protein